MAIVKETDVNARLEAGADIYGFVPCDSAGTAVPDADTLYVEAADETEAFEWLEIASVAGDVAKAPSYWILNVRKPIVTCSPCC